MNFASEYASYFFDIHFECRYNPEHESVETVREYNYKTADNLFNIDDVYDDVKDKPFIYGRKTELEMTIMCVWLESITGDIGYWPEYVDKDTARGKIINSGRNIATQSPPSCKGQNGK